MAIVFQRQRATFPSTSGRAQSMELAFTFSTKVTSAESAINGYSIGYTNSDHHLWRVQVDSTVTGITGPTVKVRVDYALRDSSGTYDDPYDGYVDVLLIANTV